MGSQADERKEITVLVTGFGPFREQYPVNPSWVIAHSLPEYLPALRAKDASTRSTVAIPDVRILVHPEPVRVTYKKVRGLVPTLWDGSYYDGRKIDMAIHIGMAGPRPFYCIERSGHRDGYIYPDVDGERLNEDRGEGWIWEGMPEELLTDLNVEDVLKRWISHGLSDWDLRISEDAGNYLCDFIYFSSLAHLTKLKQEKKVVFLHVPADASLEACARGKEIALNLIRSMVESEFLNKEQGKSLE